MRARPRRRKPGHAGVQARSFEAAEGAPSCNRRLEGRSPEKPPKHEPYLVYSVQTIHIIRSIQRYGTTWPCRTTTPTIGCSTRSGRAHRTRRDPGATPLVPFPRARGRAGAGRPSSSTAEIQFPPPRRQEQGRRTAAYWADVLRPARRRKGTNLQPSRQEQERAGRPAFRPGRSRRADLASAGCGPGRHELRPHAVVCLSCPSDPDLGLEAVGLPRGQPGARCRTGSQLHPLNIGRHQCRPKRPVAAPPLPTARAGWRRCTPRRKRRRRARQGGRLSA
jgi:hypothetical protein